MTRKLRVFLFSLLAAVGVSGCGGDGLPDNARLLEIFESGQTGVWVKGHGTVSQVLSDNSVGGQPRQRFMVQIEDSLRVQVRHQVVNSPRVPAERGDVIAFQGRYEWNASGGLISLTHQDPAQPGGGGWVSHRGTRYD